MVDFIKLNLGYLDESVLLNHPELEPRFAGTFKYHTAEVTYPFQAKIDGLTFTIYSSRNKELKGSLHKYFNIRTNNGNHNYSDFTHEDIKWVIADLEKRFSIDSSKTYVHQLEYGFNLEFYQSPTEFLEQRVKLFKFSPPSRRIDFNGQGFLLVFESTEYYIKLYDKSRQYKLNKYILRVELKSKKSRVTGVTFLDELRLLETLKSLYNIFYRRLEDLLIVDSIENNSALNINEQSRLYKMMNGNHWTLLTIECDAIVLYRIKQKFLKYLNDHNLLFERKLFLYWVRLKASSLRVF